MTIAGLALRPRKMPTLARVSLAEQDHARRSRRLNMVVYFLIWSGFFAYALGVAMTASVPASALDRFLPLQLATGVAAAMVFVSGRSLGRRSTMRRLRWLPATFSTLALCATLLAVLAAAGGQEDVPGRAAPVKAGVAYNTIVVSL